MSIHDVDKVSPDRSRPIPLKHDSLNPQASMAKGTNSVNYITGASSESTLAAGKNGQFTIVNSGKFDATAFPQSTTDPGAGNYTHDILILLELSYGFGFTPASLIYFLQQGSSQYVQLPYVYTVTTATSMLWVNIHAVSSPDTLLIAASYTAYGAAFTIPNGIFKWFLMQQTAN